MHIFRAFGRAAIFELKKSQDGFHRMPLIGESGFGSLDRLSTDIPMCVDPIGISNHEDNSVITLGSGSNWGDWGQGAFRRSLSEIFSKFFFSVSGTDFFYDFRVGIGFWRGGKL